MCWTLVYNIFLAEKMIIIISFISFLTGARSGVLARRQWFQSPIFSLNNDQICVKTHYLIDQLLNFGTQLLELFFL